MKEWEPKPIKLTQIGKNFYDEEGHTYSRSNPTAKHAYFRCHHSKLFHCLARVSARDRNYDKAMLNNDHNHKADLTLFDKLKFDVELEQKFNENPFFPKRDIYHNAKTKVKGISDNLNIPRLTQKNSTLHRRKKRHIPVLPKTIADFEKLISQETYNSTFTKDNRNLPFYRGVWTKHQSEENIVYISESVLQTFNTLENGTMRGDGTFKVLPSHIKFRQLFIVSIEYRDRSYPLAYILMKKKNFRSYDMIFGHLKKLITVNITEFMADYELATRKAVTKHFPNAMLAGCYFHYCQAIRKAAKRHGLSKDVRFAHAIKEVSSLALLPNNFVSKGFEHIGKRFKDSIRWTRFSQYWDKQWKKANISVFGLIHRTNNFAESFNRSINTLIKRKHPDLWTLIHNLKKVEMDEADEILKAHLGVIIPTRRTEVMRSMDRKIKEATEVFKKTGDIPRFLDNVTCDTNLDVILNERIHTVTDDADEINFEEDDDDEEVIPNIFRNATNFFLRKDNHPQQLLLLENVTQNQQMSGKSLKRRATICLPNQPFSKRSLILF